MFRLEKVFQNDDSGFIYFVIFFKTIILFSSIYITSILQYDTIYDLISLEVFKNTNFFIYSFFLTLLFFIFCFLLKDTRYYKKNFISFIKEDLLILVISNFITFSIFLIFKFNFIFNLDYIYLNIVIVGTTMISHLYFNNVYQNLIDKNVIQKNIMLVGSFEEIKKMLMEDLDKIFVFKCCIISDYNDKNIKYAKSEFKIPIFKQDEDIRSILEYHSLGQIWILNGDDENKLQIFEKIIKYSVDTLNIKLKKTHNLKGQQLLANKYEYVFYEWSRFYGIKLFLKIIMDKLFSLFFLILASPILILATISIYIEDGFPILFTQNRTGWDGRRFRIFKLRSLKKTSFDKTRQVSRDDERLLKIGKILRRYSIDELPQFINVLNGDMSIVGPRPHMVEHDIHYSSLFNNFLKRHKCNPGLTGWAQVNGLRGATPKPEIMKRRMEYDLWYLNNWTLGLDIYIIFKTFYAIFKYKGD